MTSSVKNLKNYISFIDGESTSDFILQATFGMCFAVALSAHRLTREKTIS